MASHLPADVQGIKPRRLWYLVAALIPVGALVASLLVQDLTRGGDIGQPLPLNQSFTVDMVSSYGRPAPPELGGERWVWAKQTGSRLAQVTCEFGDDPLLTFSSVGYTTGAAVEIEADGAHWRSLVVLFAVPAGRHQITCVALGDGGDSPTLSIGAPPRNYYDTPRERVLTTLTWAGLTPTGLLVGALIASVVAVRRRANRSRYQPESNLTAS